MKKTVKDWAFYTKWAACFFIIVGTYGSALEVFPLNLIFTSMGSILWLAISIKWNEPSMVALNAFLAGSMIIMIVEHFKVGGSLY